MLHTGAPAKTGRGDDLISPSCGSSHCDTRSHPGHLIPRQAEERAARGQRGLGCRQRERCRVGGEGWCASAAGELGHRGTPAPMSVAPDSVQAPGYLGKQAHPTIKSISNYDKGNQNLGTARDTGAQLPIRMDFRGSWMKLDMPSHSWEFHLSRQ
jgi:hypothetical protein